MKIRIVGCQKKNAPSEYFDQINKNLIIIIIIIITLCEYAGWSEHSMGAHVEGMFSDVTAQMISPLQLSGHIQQTTKRWYFS